MISTTTSMVVFYDWKEDVHRFRRERDEALTKEIMGKMDYSVFFFADRSRGTFVTSRLVGV